LLGNGAGVGSFNNPYPFKILFHDVLAYSHGIAVEVDADLHHLAVVGRVGEGVAMAVDLVDGFSGGAVDLELKDVGVGFTFRRYCAAGMPHLLCGLFF